MQWTVDGGAGVEIIFDNGPRREAIVRNVRAARVRPNAQWIDLVPAHGKHALICAGGPSLKRELSSVRAHKQFGGDLFALSGAGKYLQSQGIEPDGHVILDSEPSCVDFVPTGNSLCLYASQCDPAVLDAAGDRLALWNAYMDDMLEIEPDARAPYVGGGSTIGTRAISLAFVLGYRKIHVYGLDSCYEGNSAHAYAQADYASHVTAVCEGKTYKTSPQLYAQAKEFREMVPALLELGAEIYVHGQGLLQDMAAAMTKPNEAA